VAAPLLTMSVPDITERNPSGKFSVNRTIGRQATDCRSFAAKRLTLTVRRRETCVEHMCYSDLSRTCRGLKGPTMAKLTAPLLSFEGSGQIARTQVYSSWKGIPYARRYTIPANPRSSDQTLTRTAFSWLNFAWRTAPGDFVAPWEAAVVGRPLIARNLWIKQNLPLLRTASDLTGMVFSPGAKGGITSTITITPGAAQLTFAGSDPSPLPAGWTVVKLVGAAIKQQDPQADTDYEVFTATDLTSPFSAVMSGLEAATPYVAAGFWVYQRSASLTDLAYSAAIAAEFTTL
jgi:hypothetical protein